MKKKPKITMAALREMSKKVPNWRGELLFVHVHPSLWDAVYDLPGFKLVPLSSEPVKGDIAPTFGHAQIFEFVLDDSLADDGWFIALDQQYA